MTGEPFVPEVRAAAERVYAALRATPIHDPRDGRTRIVVSLVHQPALVGRKGAPSIEPRVSPAALSQLGIPHMLELLGVDLNTLRAWLMAGYLPRPLRHGALGPEAATDEGAYHGPIWERAALVAWANGTIGLAATASSVLAADA